MTKELKVLRARFEYSQSDIAKLLGFRSTSSYSRKENGDIEFSLSEVKKLKEIFKLSPDEVTEIFLT